jgi:hypothetical protein
MTNEVEDNCSNQSSKFTKGSDSKVIYKKVGKEDENDVCNDCMNLRGCFSLSNLTCNCHIIFVNNIDRSFTAVNHLAWSVKPIFFPSTNDFIATDVGHLSWAVSNVIIKHSVVDCSFS